MFIKITTLHDTSITLTADMVRCTADDETLVFMLEENVEETSEDHIQYHRPTFFQIDVEDEDGDEYNYVATNVRVVRGDFVTLAILEGWSVEVTS